MNAIQVLKADHKRIEEIFRELEQLNGRRGNKKGLVQRMVKELNAHTLAEEKVLYPAAVTEIPDARRLVLKALEEHHMMKLELSEIEKMGIDDERGEAKVLVLIDAFRVHVLEEENVLFPALRTALPRKRLEEIGAMIERVERNAPKAIDVNVPRLPRKNGQIANGAGMMKRAGRVTGQRPRIAAGSKVKRAASSRVSG